MDTLKYLVKKYKLAGPLKSPLELPNVSRGDLAKVFTELGFSKGAQVGTWEGTYTTQLCAANPKLKLIGVDLNSSTPRKVVPDNCKLVHMSSLDAAHRTVDGSLDFVYLDTNTNLTATMEDLALWSKKVRVGGVIAGHDFFRYRPETGRHTRQAVMAYTGAYKINPLMIIGLNKDRIRSWLWVKA